MNTSQDKLKAIEGIRGIACFMVVLSHLSRKHLTNSLAYIPR